jgi:phosphatidylinositol kinase/protein kinase (PI-3  family)
MTPEYLELMGTRYQEFVSLIIEGLDFVKENLEELLLTIEILTKDQKYACVKS